MVAFIINNINRLYEKLKLISDSGQQIQGEIKKCIILPLTQIY